MARTGLAFGTLIFFSACSAPTRDTEYFLIDQLPARPAGEIAEFELGQDRRPGFFHHPPATARFLDVPSAPPARFTAGAGMLPKAWDTESDGAVFKVSCTDSRGERVPLGSFPVVTGDRRWREIDVALRPCSAPTTTLELTTTCGGAEDCRWDWAVWGEPTVHGRRPLAIAPPRLVLVISIDTLRADHLGLYGWHRPTSPHLGELAADAVVFETAVAAASWTLPSHASLLTSTYPLVHGAAREHTMADGLTLLAEVFQQAGWQTAAFVDGVWLASKFGFDLGFEIYDEAAPPGSLPRQGARRVRRKLLRWLEEAEERPAFVFWHIFDVHSPYGAAAPFGGRFREDATGRGSLAELEETPCGDHLELPRFSSFPDLVAAYDEGILQTDHAVGELLRVLAAAGRYDDALIVVTSDHGESLFDHGIYVGHGSFLTENEIRVPLLVKLPGNERGGRRVASLARLIDVAPTVLERVGLPIPPSFQGTPLLAALATPPRTAFGSLDVPGTHYVRDEEHKLITPWSERGVGKFFECRFQELAGDEPVRRRFAAVRGERFYDLRHDPGEEHDLAGSSAEDLRKYRAAVELYISESPARRRGAAPSPGLSAEEKERLEALGYVDP